MTAAVASAARIVASSSSRPSPAWTAAANREVGRDAIGEATERLVTDDEARVEVDDRLEEWREGGRVEDRLDGRMAFGIASPILELRAQEGPERRRERGKGRQMLDEGGGGRRVVARDPDNADDATRIAQWRICRREEPRLP